MKYSLLFLILCGSALAVDAPSKIESVTVYSDRARVTRVADVKVPAGESVVRFMGLPVNLDESSVQASGTAEGNVKILGIEVRSVLTAEVLDESVRALEKQMQEFNDTQATLAAESQDINERRQFLQNVRQGLVSPQSGADKSSQNLAQVKSLYEFYSSELQGLSKRLQAIAIETRDLQPRKELIEGQLDMLRGSGAKASKDVLVSVKAEDAAALRVQVSYNMANASWVPAYDARVNTKDGKIDLMYQAVVRQQTGENWDNTKLSLSTARPNVGGRMAELNPWWLKFGEFIAMRKGGDGAIYQSTMNNAPQSASASVLATAPMEEAKKKEDMTFETATIDSSGISTVFEIKLPVTVPCDGEPRKLAITSQKFDSQLEHIATPKLTQSAYLTAKLTNSTGTPILGGEVNLFRDGDFIGKSFVKFIPDKADFVFYLGVDDDVKIMRKTLLDKTADLGIIQKRKGVSRKYETTINNFKAQPVKITVLDQIPVSQDASIVVSGVKFSEAPKSENKDTGKLEWQFDLAPKGQKILTNEFSVEWPPDKVVGGL